MDGNFTIEVPTGSDLVFSYIGFATVTLKATPQMQVSLKEDTEMIDEVVVVGYSTEKKSDLTGSVSVVKMKDVTDTPTGNVIQSLQGRVAGMNVTTDGTPGGLSTSTSIRGASSFRSDANGPLYVIDGVMTRENPGTIIDTIYWQKRRLGLDKYCTIQYSLLRQTLADGFGWFRKQKIPQ